MMKRKLEVLILGTCALIALGLAVRTRYLPEDWFDLDYLISISSLLIVASFSIRAMLPLRVLAVASQIFAIPYFMLQPTPLWTPVGWTGLFMAINLYHITCILLERRPVRFAPDEQRFYELTFQRFEPREFLKPLKLGEWKTARQGDKILTRRDPITQIAVPIAGTVSAGHEDSEVAQLGPDELIGTGIALTGQPSFISASFAEDPRYMSWSLTDIRTFLDKNPDLAIKFKDVVNRFLVAQINKFALYLESGH